MTDRFLRDYILTIGLGAQAVVIRPPFRIVFSADKSDDATLNKMTLKIDGLSEDKRKILVRDKDDKPPKNVKADAEGNPAPPKALRPNDNRYFPIELKIGYQGRVETIFKGSVDEAGSTREGAQFVTTLTCLDGGHDFLTAFVSTSVTSKAAAVDAVLGTMPNTSKGKIGAQKDITRPKILVGNSMQTIQDMLDPGQRWFIDDERLNILGGDEVVSGYIPVISAETGLINVAPKKKETIMTTKLNPSVKVGGLVKLVSTTSPGTNGIYKVNLISYSGDFDGSDWDQKISGTLAENYTVPK
jgi:hypothetical protein